MQAASAQRKGGSDRVSFWKRMKTNKKIKKSLQKQKTRQITPMNSSDIPNFFRIEKRTSRPALPGNMTVEAALVLPLFLFAIVNLLSLLLMFQTFSLQEGKLHQTGREMSLLAYGDEGGEQDIRIVKVSRISPVFPVAAFPAVSVVNGCVMHKWIGYDLSQRESGGTNEKDEMVYITRSGSAYHRERNCVYLNPSVSMLGLAQAQAAVNQDGRRYTACELCGEGSGIVYVTKAGSRYHSTITCSGLRRTIDYVTLQEAAAAGYHACPKCG